MRFDRILPTEKLRPYVQHLVISENAEEGIYKVFPSTGLVIGFQYKGTLATVKDNREDRLSSAGISGILDRYKIFKNSAKIGTILVYLTEMGLSSFCSCPAHELFGQSISLDTIFDRDKINETEEKLAFAKTDQQRLHLVEQFLLSQLHHKEKDSLIVHAVQLIHISKGTIKIKELSQKLFISQGPLEKRFRQSVGTTPKKFASIVRFNAVLDNMETSRSLTEICYHNNYFDQAHFTRDFKQYTGHTPENFKRFL